MPQPTVMERALVVARVDRSPRGRPPATSSTLIAAAVAITGSLVIDALLVAVGTAVFPSIAGFSHFRFFDYGSLTFLGVAAACASWPMITRISSAPRWLFLRLAVTVSLTLFVPDGWLLLVHQPPKAVGVLMVMHLLIALITYNVLVHLAPVRVVDDPTRTDDPRRTSSEMSGPKTFWWVAMMVGVGVELVLGVVTLVLVPTTRPNGWLPPEARPLYLVHALVGGILGIGALSLLGKLPRLDRISRMAVAAGAIGVALAAGGGVLTVDNSSRFFGMGLMLVGSLLAGFAYLVPVIEALPDPAAPPDPQAHREG